VTANEIAALENRFEMQTWKLSFND